jgi:tetratricopeptide (TPR) repeat protein
MKLDPESNELQEEAKKLLEEGRWEDAVQELDGILETNPMQLSLWRAKADALVASQKLGDALVCYGHMLEIEPGDFVVHAQRAEILEFLEREDEALAGYQEALKLAPSNVALLIAMGRLLTRLDRTSEAIVTYDRIGELTPQDPRYLIGKGDAQIRAGLIDEAFVAFEQAARMDQDAFGAEEWTTWGDALFEAEKTEEALKFYEKAIASNRGYAMAYRGKAQVLREIPERSSEAMEYFDTAIKLEPKNAWFQLNKGNLHYDRQEYELAATCYTKATELDPKVTLAWKNLCFTQEARGQFTQALLAIEKAIELDPTAADAWLHKGFCLSNLGRTEEAIVSYDEALKREPGDLWANNNKGWMLAQKDKHEEALPFFHKAIEADPGESAPLVNAAKSLIKLGRYNQALESLKKGLASITQKRDVFFSIAYLYSDFILDDDKALEYYAKCIDLDPADQHVRGNIAECLIKMDKFAEGRAEAEKLVGHWGDAERESAMSIVVLASYALEGDINGRTTQFEVVLKNFRAWCPEAKPRNPETIWTFGGLVNKINSSSISAESKFLVLTAIDVHLGEVTHGSLPFFIGSKPHANQRSTANSVAVAAAQVGA